MNLDQVVATLLGSGEGRWSTAKLSRIETARQLVRVDELERLLDVYGVEAERRESLRSLVRAARRRGWWDAYADTISEDVADGVSLEAEARSIRTFDGSVVHGLLQTDDYSREVIRVGLMQFASSAEVERRVEVHRERRRGLHARAPEPIRLWSIIEEGVLRRSVGTGALMHEQCKRLAELAGLPNVMLQVLPFGSGAHPGMTGGFSILEFSDPHLPDVVSVDVRPGVMYVENDAQVYHYSLAFNQLAMSALGVDESQEFISDLAESQTR